jgi:nitrous oxidase accessory protein NosD
MATLGNTNVKIEGTSIEHLCRSFSSSSPCSRGIHVGSGATATKIEGVRLEGADIGVHLDTGSTDAVGLSQYCTNNTLDRKNDVILAGLTRARKSRSATPSQSRDL